MEDAVRLIPGSLQNANQRQTLAVNARQLAIGGIAALKNDRMWLSLEPAGTA